MTATSTPPLQAAACRMETSNWHGEDGEGTMMKNMGRHDDKTMGQDSKTLCAM